MKLKTYKTPEKDINVNYIKKITSKNIVYFLIPQIVYANDKQADHEENRTAN